VTSELEGLLETAGLQVTKESARNGMHSGSWRESISDFRSCNGNTVSVKKC